MERRESTADLHIHTTASDGAASPEAVLAYVAAQTDMRLIAITDHDTLSGALEARRLAPRYGVEVIVGCEISTRAGHLLALFIERPVAAGRDLAATVAAVRAQGGLAFAAHPYGALVPSIGRRGLCGPESGLLESAGLDGLEAFNASLWRAANNTRAARRAADLGLAQIGGSDAHHLAMIGRGRTRFPGQSAADLRRALLARATRAEGLYWGLRGVAGIAALRLRSGRAPWQATA